MDSRTTRTIVAALAISATSCYQTVLLDPDALESEPLTDIQVTTKDSVRYEFAWGDYSVVRDSLENRSIRGKGLVQRKGVADVERFEGDISFRDIQQITASESTMREYLPNMAALFVVVWLLLFYGKLFG